MDVLAGGDGGGVKPRPRLRRFSSLPSFSPGDMLLFRAPQPSYLVTAWPGELCMLGSAVCLALERVGGASTVVLFCHGTSSDLGTSRRSLDILRERLDCHVVAVEYPGYGLARDEEPSEERLNEAVRSVFLHLTGPMAWCRERIIVIGRSLGSGPATCLAREFQPGALVLLAPFSSVKEIAGGIVGDTLADVFNLNHWNNLEKIRKTTSPTLFLHGLKDEVVPHLHSLDLYKASIATQKYVGLLYNSDHNRIDWPVACDVYAKPFLEKACPAETKRTLGVQVHDVSRLTNLIEPSSTTNPDYIVPRAEAAWRQRRARGGVEHAAAESEAGLAMSRAAEVKAALAVVSATSREAARKAAAERAEARTKAAEANSLLPRNWKWRSSTAKRSSSWQWGTTKATSDGDDRPTTEGRQSQPADAGEPQKGEHEASPNNSGVVRGSVAAVELAPSGAGDAQKSASCDDDGCESCEEAGDEYEAVKGSEVGSSGKETLRIGSSPEEAAPLPLSARMRSSFSGFFSGFGSTTAFNTGNGHADSSSASDNDDDSTTQQVLEPPDTKATEGVKAEAEGPMQERYSAGQSSSGEVKDDIDNPPGSSRKLRLSDFFSGFGSALGDSAISANNSDSSNGSALGTEERRPPLESATGDEQNSDKMKSSNEISPHVMGPGAPGAGADGVAGAGNGVASAAGLPRRDSTRRLSGFGGFFSGFGVGDGHDRDRAAEKRHPVTATPTEEAASVTALRVDSRDNSITMSTSEAAATSPVRGAVGTDNECGSCDGGRRKSFEKENAGAVCTPEPTDIVKQPSARVGRHVRACSGDGIGRGGETTSSGGQRRSSEGRQGPSPFLSARKLGGFGGLFSGFGLAADASEIVNDRGDPSMTVDADGAAIASSDAAGLAASAGTAGGPNVSAYRGAGIQGDRKHTSESATSSGRGKNADGVTVFGGVVGDGENSFDPSPASICIISNDGASVRGGLVERGNDEDSDRDGAVADVRGEHVARSGVDRRGSTNEGGSVWSGIRTLFKNERAGAFEARSDRERGKTRRKILKKQ